MASAVDPSDLRDLRDALGRFATGVTIVTTLDLAGRPIGLTANSFNSVSLDPPIVLWSLARRSLNLRSFLDAGHFAVNVLAADQQALSDRFAKPACDRFAGVDWEAGTAGVPVLPGAVASFECATDNLVEGGDHVIFLGRVARFRHADKEPLIYHAGRYGTPAARG